MFKTVIFDLDGTLADTMPDVALSVNHALKAMNYKPLDPARIRRAIGPGKDDFIRTIFPGVEHPDEGTFLSLFRSHYWEHCLDHTRLYPGMETVLRNLKGIGLGIASNKPRRFIMRIIRGLGVEPLFRIVMSPDDVEEAKPHPEMIVRILESLDTAPETALMVGDTDKDILAGRNAGVRVCGVRYGYGDRSVIRALKPDYLIHTPEELLSIVNQHTFR